MKHILLLCCFAVAFFGVARTADATTKYWIGAPGGSFTDNANWSLSSGGTNNTTAPGSSDVATFTSANASSSSLSSTVNVSGINMVSGYTGTLTQSAGVSVTVGTGHFVIADGIYVGSTGIINTSGNFTLSGGVFTASSATTTVQGSFSRTSGTFNANGGIMEFRMTSTNGAAISAAGVTFATVALTANATTFSYIYYLDSNLTMTGDLRVFGVGFYGATFYSRSSLNPTITVGGNFSINDGSASGGMFLGGSSAVNNITLNVAGNVTISGTNSGLLALIVFNGTGVQAITKTSINVYSSSIWSSTKSSGTLTLNSFTGGTVGTDTFTWSGGTILTPSAGLNFSTAIFKLTGGTFTGSSGTTTFSGNFTSTGGTYDANGGITEFRITSPTGVAISASGLTFHNVAFTANGLSFNYIYYIDSNLNMTGDLRVFGVGYYGAFFYSRSSLNPTITVGGNFTLNDGSSNAGMFLGASGATNSITLNVAGNVTISGTNSSLYAPIVFSGTGVQTITKTGSNVQSSSIWSSTKSSGTLTLNSFSGGTVGTDTFTWSGGTILSPSAGLNFSTTVFKLTGGTFTASSATTTFSGSFTRTGGTFDANGGTVSFYQPAQLGTAIIAAGNSTFHNVAFWKDGYTSPYILYYIDDSFTTTGFLRVYHSYSDTGPIYVRSRNSASPTITVQGNLEFPYLINTVATLGSGTASEQLSVNLSGNFRLTATGVTLYAPIIFSGTSTQTFTRTAGTINSLSVWTINKTDGKVSLLSTLAHPSTITVSAGTLDANGQTLTAATALNLNAGGTLQLQGGETLTVPTFGVGSTTVIYTGSGSYTGLKAGNTYNNLMFNGSGTWTQNTTLDVNGNLSIVAGSLLSSANAITLAGNWLKNGTFTHGNNTVTLDGTDQSIGGTSGTTFYNFIKNVTATSTLTFPTSVTTIIANNSTLTGVNAGRLRLRSSSEGVQSSVNFSNTGSRTIQYLDVMDNNNTNATAVSCLTGCIDSTLNTNWIFSMTISTDAASSILHTGATLNGTIVSTGGVSATQSGFAYGTTPTLQTVVATTTLGAAGVGSFSQSISSLSCNTTYYSRAYAINSAGTWYGDILSFQTLSCAPTVTTSAASSITSTTTVFNGNVTSTGGENATESGFSYSTVSTLTSGVSTSTLGAFVSTGALVSTTTSLSCNTVYYYRAYATNSGGTGFGSIQTFTSGACPPTLSTDAATSVLNSGATFNATISATNGENATESGFTYGTSSSIASPISTTTLGSFSGTGSFNESITTLTCNTTYYYRAYATNSGGTGYGAIQTFLTTACPPTISTITTVDSITQTSATIGGSIDDDGGENGLEHGLSYGTENLLLSPISTSTLGSYTGTGTFTQDLSSLTCGTIYYYRSYGENSAGVTFGDINYFTTSACAVAPGSSGSSHGGIGYIGTARNPVASNPNNLVFNPQTPILNPGITLVSSWGETNTAGDEENTSGEEARSNFADAKTKSDALSNGSGSGGASQKLLTNTLKVIPYLNSPSEGNLNSIIHRISEVATNLSVAKKVVVPVAVSGLFLTLLTFIQSLFTGVGSVADIARMPFRLWSLGMAGLGLRRRFKFWGTVYDSETKRPLDPAYVTLVDSNGVQVGDAITDLNGRYGFLVPPGTYKMTVDKTHYVFPSLKVSGNSSDSVYNNLYFGNTFTVGKGDVIAYNVPMDPTAFDWNEYAKKDRKLISFYARNILLITRVARVIIGLGFAISIYSVISDASTSNILIVSAYLILNILNLVVFRPRSYGQVLDRNGRPLAFGIVTIFNPAMDGMKIAQKVTDKFGRFYCLIPDGKYMMTIERKNSDGSYEKVFTSDAISFKGGVVRKRIVV